MSNKGYPGWQNDYFDPEPEQQRRLVAIEGCNGYYLKDTETGREACMGDGVDMEAGLHAEVGTEEFLRIWQSEIDFNEAIYIEAYFPEQADCQCVDLDIPGQNHSCPSCEETARQVYGLDDEVLPY